MYIYIFSFSLLLLIYSSLFPIVPGLFLNTCSNIRGAESITCRPIHWSQDRSSSSLLATMLEDSRSPPSPPPTMSGGLDWGPFGTNIPKAEREKGRGGRASLFSRTRSHGPRALVTRSVTQTFCSLLTFGLYISRVCIHSHFLSFFLPLLHAAARMHLPRRLFAHSNLYRVRFYREEREEGGARLLIIT